MTICYVSSKTKTAYFLKDDEIKQMSCADAGFKNFLTDNPDIQTWFTDAEENPLMDYQVLYGNKVQFHFASTWDVWQLVDRLSPLEVFQCLYLLGEPQSYQTEFKLKSLNPLFRMWESLGVVKPVAQTKTYPLDISRFMTWFFKQKIAVPYDIDVNKREITIVEWLNEEKTFTIHLGTMIEINSELYELLLNDAEACKWMELPRPKSRSYIMTFTQFQRGIKNIDVALIGNKTIFLHETASITDGKVLLQKIIEPYQLLSFSHLHQLFLFFKYLQAENFKQTKLHYRLLYECVKYFYLESEMPLVNFTLTDFSVEESLSYQHPFDTSAKIVEVQKRQGGFGARKR